MADLILYYTDLVLEPTLYGEWFPEGVLRECVSFFLSAWIGGTILYLGAAGFSYHFLYDKEILKDPRMLPNQVNLEIRYALWSIPYMALLTVPIFVAEVHGYSRLYDDISEYGWGFYIFSLFAFVAFTDMLIYFIHRGFHDVKWMYKYIHKPHHRWLVTTPFASHAFHPVDGWGQGLPYHIYIMLFPFHKYTYLVVFVLLNLWTVSIHDCDYRVPEVLRPYINGAAHHTDHHSDFNVNYGQYLTLWDRIGGSFQEPKAFKKMQAAKEA